MSESNNRINTGDAECRNIPCTTGSSLLKLSARAAYGTADFYPVQATSLFEASPFFDTARDAAKALLPKWNQLVGVPAVVTPTAPIIYDPMVTQSDNQQTNLPRRFLRENAGAIISNPLLKSKGRESRQAHE